MPDRPQPAGFLKRRRAERARRTADGRALRSEFELDRPRGLAALRALAASVGELEAERLRTHREPVGAERTRARARATTR